MKAVCICLLALGCSGQVDQSLDPICLEHGAGDFLSHGMACDEATAPQCGFTAVNDPVPVKPGYGVEFVCHCIGGVYACFGVQP